MKVWGSNIKAKVGLQPLCSHFQNKNLVILMIARFYTLVVNFSFLESL